MRDEAHGSEVRKRVRGSGLGGVASAIKKLRLEQSVGEGPHHARESSLRSAEAGVDLGVVTTPKYGYGGGGGDLYEGIEDGLEDMEESSPASPAVASYHHGWVFGGREEMKNGKTEPKAWNASTGDRDSRLLKHQCHDEILEILDVGRQPLAGGQESSSQYGHRQHLASIVPNNLGGELIHHYQQQVQDAPRRNSTMRYLNGIRVDTSPDQDANYCAVNSMLKQLHFERHRHGH